MVPSDRAVATFYRLKRNTRTQPTRLIDFIGGLAAVFNGKF